MNIVIPLECDDCSLEEWCCPDPSKICKKCGNPVKWELTKPK